MIDEVLRMSIMQDELLIADTALARLLLQLTIFQPSRQYVNWHFIEDRKLSRSVKKLLTTA